ncbi:MAG: FkbM family methyltransferase [Cyanobacteriota bacterium]
MTNNTYFFDDFITKLIICSYKWEENNWETYRYGKNESLDLDSLSNYLKWVLNNREEIEKFISFLNDSESIELVKYIMLFRSLGYKHVKIPINKELMSSKNISIANSFITNEVSSDKSFFVTGKLKSFLVPFMNQEIDLDAGIGNVIYSYFVKQYYFQRNNYYIMPIYGDYVIDAGSCFGDTALGFSVSVGKIGKVFSFEVVPDHIEICKVNFEKNKDFSENIELVEYALSDEPYKEINIELIGPGSRELKDNYSPFSSIKVKTQSIDNLVKEKNIEKIDFIKMDIEGAEIPALIGASETIKKFKPKLAISAYHKIDDFITISNFIKSLEPSYKIFVDHYTIHSEETVIYATIEDEYLYDEKYKNILDYYDKKDFKNAEYFSRVMYSMFHDDIKINNILYKILMELGNFQESTEILSSIIEKGEYNKDNIKDFVTCLREIGENDLADSYSKIHLS